MGIFGLTKLEKCGYTIKTKPTAIKQDPPIIYHQIIILLNLLMKRDNPPITTGTPACKRLVVFISVFSIIPLLNTICLGSRSTSLAEWTRT